MNSDVIRLYAEIIELYEKPKVPSGELGHNVKGHTYDFSNVDPEATSCRGLIDIGILDVKHPN
ncbi:MAG: hypothetical protein GXY94_10905 [Bacteroidales bacterium]|jgi:predicted amino acid racemase|nr:hypothetical protein [Bacteroidales bacterium]